MTNKHVIFSIEFNILTNKHVIFSIEFNILTNKHIIFSYESYINYFIHIKNKSNLIYLLHLYIFFTIYKLIKN